METQTNSATVAAADTRAKNLTCWRTATSRQCLRVETANEVHLFPYGYFQHAKFSRQNGKVTVQIKFQDQMVTAIGRGLEPLCDALERLAVERIRLRPEKYEGLGQVRASLRRSKSKKATDKNRWNKSGHLSHC